MAEKCKKVGGQENQIVWIIKQQQSCSVCVAVNKTKQKEGHDGDGRGNALNDRNNRYNENAGLLAHHSDSDMCKDLQAIRQVPAG